MDVSKYAAIFLAESREHLSSCNQLLLKWERDPAATDAVGGLFRSIHTIKGMAATMGFTGVAELPPGRHGHGVSTTSAVMSFAAAGSVNAAMTTVMTSERMEL